jgi:hypothetical protein
MAGARAAVERRKASASRRTRGLRPKRMWMATSDAWRGPTGQSRLPALRLPSFSLRRKNSWLWSANLGRTCVARTRALAPSAPAKRGRGTTGAREASEPWWRGRRARGFVGVAGRFSSQEDKKKRANENVWRSPTRVRSVESCAPSTTLLRRVVPLPRFAGADVMLRRFL